MWVHVVERQNRLRLSEEATRSVRFLKPGQETICKAFLGSAGQLQIAPEIVSLAVTEEINTALTQMPARPEEAVAPWMDIARFSATVWLVKFQPEPGRKRLTVVLPREARKLGIVPNTGGVAVFFVSGDVVEIWRHDRWVEHNAKARSDLDEIAEAVPDSLSERH